MRPSATSSSIRVTWLPNEPAEWWFLPWMSCPIAPPTVTWRVPGRTGTHRPNGSAARISWSRLTPPSTTARAVSALSSWIRLKRLMSSTSPPEFWALSPYERPRPRATTPRRRWSGPEALASLTAATAAEISSTERGVRTWLRAGAVRPHPVRRLNSVSSEVGSDGVFCVVLTGGGYRPRRGVARRRDRATRASAVLGVRNGAEAAEYVDGADEGIRDHGAQSSHE